MKGVMVIPAFAVFALLFGQQSPSQEHSHGQQQHTHTQTPQMEALIQEEKPTIDRVAGAAVYKLPLISKVNARDVQLFPHYKPKRAAEGWLHAYLEPATPTVCTVLVEEIPPHSRKLIGRADTGYYLFIAVTGMGYTEFRDDLSEPGKGVVWSSKDYFYKPWGVWYGHANPFDQPARVMTFICHLDKDDLLNPFIQRTRTVQEQTFPGERREAVPEDVVIEDTDWDAVQQQAASGAAASIQVLHRGPANTPVFQGLAGGTPLNMSRMEWPLFYKKLRGEEGWRGGHVEPAKELGYRAYFDVMEEIPPHSSEIGHKHGGGLWFLIMKGKGYMALRATLDAPETRINWEEWDMWVMPWLTAAGTWHSHANPYDEPARFITAGQIIWDDDGLLNGQIDRVYHISGDGVDDETPDNVFRKRGETSPEID